MPPELGDRREQQIRADSRGRRDTKPQYKQWCHERATADPCEADDGPNDQTAGNECDFLHGWDCSQEALKTKRQNVYIDMGKTL